MSVLRSFGILIRFSYQGSIFQCLLCLFQLCFINQTSRRNDFKFVAAHLFPKMPSRWAAPITSQVQALVFHNSKGVFCTEQTGNDTD